MDIIRNRRSIRSFIKGYVIKEEVYKDLLEAAVSAPSAMNGKPWFFIIINDDAVKEKLTSSVPSISRFLDASGFIIVAARTENIKSPLYHQDLSAATENILLEATKKKLGSCWIGLKDTKERIPNIKEILNVPDSIELFSMIALGKPQEEDIFDKPKVRELNDEIINFNGWKK